MADTTKIISHVEMTQVDSAGNLNVMYPKNTSDDVVLHHSNSNIPSAVVSGTNTTSDLANALGTAAFKASSEFSSSTHVHGNITNAGAIGTASGKVITTGTNGVLQATTENTAFNKNFETSTSNIKVAGTVAVGTSTNIARADHVHPAQTSVSGNAGTATKLASAHTIALSGAATGTATSFDGSGNISIPVTTLDATKLSGLVPLSSIPAAALERCVTVTNDTARFALTTDDVQLGDTVKVTSTKLMYLVIDTSKLSTEDGYTVYVAGSAATADTATTANKLATTRSISATGDATWSVSFDGSANATAAITLGNSGATAGSYGPSANATPAHSASFSVPYFTVDAKGRVTAASTKTITLPADNNTDTKVTQISDTTTESAIPIIVAASATPTSGAASTAKYVTGVTITPSTKTITATTFAGDLSGKLATARTISLTGKVTGSVSFDGSANVSLATTVASASTSTTGIVQLSSATNSTSTTLAATASAVKSAYDLASSKVKMILSSTKPTEACLWFNQISTES